jgi:hypothetical protein
MNIEELYQRIKDRNLTEVSKDLYHQICIGGSTNHRIIGTCEAVLYLYGFDFKAMDLPTDITYEQFRKEEPGLFEDHMETLAKCLNAGFLI